MFQRNAILNIMKNLNKGFIVSLLIAVIALLVIGGGVYVLNNKKAEAPAPVDNIETQQSNQIQQQTNTQTLPVENKEVKSKPISITVLSPNGGEIWQIGSTQTIKWQTISAPQNSFVSLSINEGSKHFNIDTGMLPTTGSYVWNISNQICDAVDCFSLSPAKDYKVKAILWRKGDKESMVNYYAQDIANDESDNLFTIK